MPNFHKAFWEYVQRKPSDKLGLAKKVFKELLEKFAFDFLQFLNPYKLIQPFLSHPIFSKNNPNFFSSLRHIA
jgi:hypothetical protein